MNPIRRILVLRFRRVGDAVISTILCSSLKRTFPDATIDYVLNDGIAPLFEHHPDIDNIITFSNDEMKSFSSYIRRVRQIIKAEKYDLILDTRSTVKTLWISLFSLSTPYRAGRKKAYNGLIQNYRTDNRFDGNGDEIDRTLKLLKPLEKTFPIKYERQFRLFVTKKEKEDFHEYMHTQGIDFSKPVIVCAVTARLVHKVWSKSRMQEALQKILDYSDAQLIFNFGGKEEKEFALQLHRDMQNNPRVFTNIEARNLRELAAMFANSTFFFGNEGGPRHISQAFDVPSFAIYPPETSKQQWLPNAGERFQGIEPADISKQALSKELSFSEKFELITVDTVWEQLQPMLDRFVIRH